MGIPTWKVLTALSVGLIVFGVYVSLVDVSFGTRGAILTFVLAVIFSGVLYVTLRFGYMIGNRIASDEE